MSAKSATRKPAAAKSRPKPPEKTAKTTSSAGTRSAVLIGIVGLVVVAAVVGFLLWQRSEPEALAAGNEPGVIARVKSLYNDIYVYKRPNGYYVLSFGAERLRYTESIVNPKDELDLPVYYTQSMTAGLAYAAGPGERRYHRPRRRPHRLVSSQERARAADDRGRARPRRGADRRRIFLRPAEGELRPRGDGRADVAREERPRLRHHHGRRLSRSVRAVPSPDHRVLRARVGALKPGGVVVQNVEPSTMLFDSAVATIGAVFDHLVFFEGQGNIVILGYDGAERTTPRSCGSPPSGRAKFGFRYPSPTSSPGVTSPNVGKTEPLTDDFAPVEYLKAIERHNEKRT